MVLELEIENKFRKIAIDDLSNESIFKCLLSIVKERYMGLLLWEIF